MGTQNDWLIIISDHSHHSVSAVSIVSSSAGSDQHQMPPPPHNPHRGIHLWKRLKVHPQCWCIYGILSGISTQPPDQTIVKMKHILVNIPKLVMRWKKHSKRMWNIAWEKSLKIIYFTASFSSCLVQNEDAIVFAPSLELSTMHTKKSPWFRIRVKSFQRTLFCSSRC